MSTGTVFMYSYIGSVVTTEFSKFADICCEIDWFDMQNDSQKCFKMILQNAQIPCQFTGYKIINLTLESFTKVFFLNFTTKKTKFNPIF